MVLRQSQLKASTACDDGYNLGAWCFNCRSKYKKKALAEKYAERFKQLHFALDEEMDWELKYLEVKAYFQEHNVSYLTDGIIAEDGINLTLWLAKQRRAYPKGKLTKEQMQKLDAIGYPFKNDEGHKEYFDIMTD